jgi:hypothetical protein
MFPNITGLHVEVKPSHAALVEKISDSLAGQLTYLSLAEGVADYSQHPELLLNIAKSILQRGTKLRKLSMTPFNFNATWLQVIAENCGSLAHIEELTLTLLKFPDGLNLDPVKKDKESDPYSFFVFSMIQPFKEKLMQLSKLKKLQID